MFVELYVLFFIITLLVGISKGPAGCDLSIIFIMPAVLAGIATPVISVVSSIVKQSKINNEKYRSQEEETRKQKQALVDSANKQKQAEEGAAFLKLCRDGSLQQIKEAITKGANVKAKNENGLTPLMFAALNNSNPEVITALIEKSDVEAVNNDGLTALMLAAGANTNPEVITALINGNAKVNASENGGNTPLMLAALANSNPDVITALIKADAFINVRNASGMSPLMFAAMFNSNPKVITALIREGADVKSENEDGLTALLVAAGKPNTEIITAFINNTDVETINVMNSKGMTPLMVAAMTNSNPDVITALINAGADVNAVNKSGYTALFFAADSNSNPEVIQALIDGGSDLSARNTNGETALMLAERRNPNSRVIMAVINEAINEKRSH